MSRCRVALAQTLSSTDAVFKPPSPPICSQLFRLCGAPHKRRNWLHLGGDGGLTPTAVLLSVSASAKRHGINPWAYLTRALKALPARPAGADLADLLPDAWANPRGGSHRRAR